MKFALNFAQTENSETLEKQKYLSILLVFNLFYTVVWIRLFGSTSNSQTYVSGKQLNSAKLLHRILTFHFLWFIIKEVPITNFFPVIFN